MSHHTYRIIRCALIILLLLSCALLTAAQEQEAQLAEANRLGQEAVKLYQAGRYAEAVPLAERSLAIREKALGPEHPTVATSLSNLATMYRAKGDFGRALPLYQRALAINEKALGPEHLNVAIMLTNLANVYADLGDYVRDGALHERALAIREKAEGPEHPDVAASLHNLAGAYSSQGDYARAASLYQRSLAIREKAFGPDHPTVADSLNGLAAVYQIQGGYGRATPLLQRALAIKEKALGPEHRDVATPLIYLGKVYQAQGDYARAAPLFQRALAILEKALGPDHPTVATALNNLATLYALQNDRVRAEPLFQRALAIREKSLGPDHPSVAESLNGLASLYQDQGDLAKAATFYQRAMAIDEKAFGPEHQTVAALLNNLASLYQAQGDYGQAVLFSQRALAILEKTLGPDHPDVALSLNGLGALYEAQGDYVRAVSFNQRGSKVDEKNIGRILATGSQQQKQLYLNLMAGNTTSAVSLHVRNVPQNADAARLALTVILQRKGRALDATSEQRAALRRRAAPDDLKLLDQLTSVQSQLATLQLSNTSTLSPEARRAEIARLNGEQDRLEDAISRRSAEFRAAAQPVTLEAVRQAVPPDAALVELFVYQTFNATWKGTEPPYGAPRYVAYVLRRDDDVPHFVDLGEAAPINANAKKLRTALAPDACFAEKRKLNQDPAQCLDVEAAKQTARVLDEQTMRPVRALLGNTKHIFLSPDGALNLIPFAALVDENNKYLVESYTLTYLTSGRDLLRLQIAGVSKDPPTVLANPLYNLNNAPATQALATQTAKRDAEFRNLDFTQLLYPPLSGTAKEATALAALIPSARVWTDKQATEAALKGVSRPRILHIATHGFFFPDQPQAITNSGGRQLIQGEAQANAAALKNENPMLRSGLILAGVNQHSSGANEDGVLTAAEAAGLDLFGTKLVVLSACETGIGEVHNGDSVYGLRRALVLAGSESQVMSLWKVSDEGTQELMTEYYTRLQRGEGRTEALRQVQLEMIRGEKRKHPFYWASFIQSGAWTTLDGKEPK
jgi:CHAT domain-containing protein/Tfp pilus assembly protein PilF